MTFLTCKFLSFTSLESNKPDDHDEEGSENFRYGSESESFGKFDIGIVWLLSGL